MAKKGSKKDQTANQESPETSKSNESAIKEPAGEDSEIATGGPPGQADEQEEEEEEVKEPPKKRQKTDKKGTEPQKSKEKQKTKQKKPVAAEAEEAQEEEAEEVAEEDQDEDTAVTVSAAATHTAGQSSTIGQLKKIEDKKPFTDQEAEQVIAEWMEKQNRPYSVQNLLDNFQHQLKRAQCMRIMDLLVESQILTCKEYGKAKVYLINQDCFPETSPDQLKLLDEQIQVRKDEYGELEDQLKQNKDKLKEASAGQANGAIQSELQGLEEDIVTLKKFIQPFQESGATMLTEKDLLKAEGDLKKWQLEWKKRKRACMDLINTISESMEMNRKDFIKKIGLDTDEENKVVCPL